MLSAGGGSGVDEANEGQKRSRSADSSPIFITETISAIMPQLSDGAAYSFSNMFLWICVSGENPQ